MDERFAFLRNRMVSDQIIARGVLNSRVLDAMRKVERHLFIPESLREQSYNDHPVQIGLGQTISQPYIVGLMTELLELTGNEKVLEIGTGSGYQSAILAECAKKVISIERIPHLADKASLLLSKMKYDNIRVITGNGFDGFAEEAPFDAIILTASPSEIPKTLTDQLADGGVLVAPEGDDIQELVRIRKNGTILSKEHIIYVRFVPMIP